MNYRELWKIWSARVLLVCATIAFAWSLASYFRNQIRFRDVESWPSVTTRDAYVVPRTIEITSGGRYGGLNTRPMEVITVDFTYALEGVTYEGSHFTPDNRVPDSSLLPDYAGFPWPAHYSPRDPSLAVLVPLPYQGTMELTVAVLSGLAFFTALCRWGVWPDGRVRNHGLIGAMGRHWFGFSCAVLLVFSLGMAERESRSGSRDETTIMTPEMEQWFSNIARSYRQSSPGSSLPDFVLEEDRLTVGGNDEVKLDPLPEPPPSSFRAAWEREKIRKLLRQPLRAGNGFGMVIWGSGILLSLYLVLSLLPKRPRSSDAGITHEGRRETKGRHL